MNNQRLVEIILLHFWDCELLATAEKKKMMEGLRSMNQSSKDEEITNIISQTEYNQYPVIYIKIYIFKEDTIMSKTLIAYFLASGVTAGAAENLAAATGTDLFPILLQN